MKKQILVYLFALFFLGQPAFAQQKKIYIALDDHTDYVYTLDEEDHRKIFLETLDYYLNLADATANNPADQQSRWNCDGQLWLVYQPGHRFFDRGFHDLPDDQPADELHHDARAENVVAIRVLVERLHILRVDQTDPEEHEKRQRADDVA